VSVARRLFRLRRSAKRPGSPPGTLVHSGEKKLEEVRLSLIDYDTTQIEEKTLSDVTEALPFKESPTVTWINIDGLHDTSVIERIGKEFDIHPLVLEDILSTQQRPKMEDYENYLYLVLRMIQFDEETQQAQDEQLSVIVGSNYVISFQEQAGDVFDPIRERLRNEKGRIRKMGPDYLTYALIDAIVDHYFTALENYGDVIAEIEEDLFQDREDEPMARIHSLKQEMIYLRKSIWPLREVLSQLSRGESKVFDKDTLIFLRDVYAHTIQVIDTVETYRDLLSGLLDLYLSTLSNRMNEVMKVLTIIATLFIPLTFIAGVYGMNFKYMPELEWRWSYPIVWLVMIVVSAVMLIYFRRKKWL